MSYTGLGATTKFVCQGGILYGSDAAGVPNPEPMKVGNMLFSCYSAPDGTAVQTGYVTDPATSIVLPTVTLTKPAPMQTYNPPAKTTPYAPSTSTSMTSSNKLLGFDPMVVYAGVGALGLLGVALIVSKKKKAA